EASRRSEELLQGCALLEQRRFPLQVFRRVNVSELLVQFVLGEIFFLERSYGARRQLLKSPFERSFQGREATGYAPPVHSHNESDSAALAGAGLLVRMRDVVLDCFVDLCFFVA